MNMLASELQDASWLDLCSGSGVMGCEAIERGVSRVWAVEKDPKTASVCRENLMLIAGGRSPSPAIEVIRRDLVSWLQMGRPSSLPTFDVVYFDPPYGSNLYEPTLLALLEGHWVSSQGVVICEHARHKKLTPPSPWTMVDERRYGTSALLLLSPPEHYPGGTDSKRQQTTPSG
jgi:16S rRNA (guanine(966)-N(2))-methyltransferase RsmD